MKTFLKNKNTNLHIITFKYWLKLIKETPHYISNYEYNLYRSCVRIKQKI